jgi:hypothetical protein
MAAPGVDPSHAAPLFWLGGQIKFSITYTHTQINTMVCVGIKQNLGGKTTKTKLATLLLAHPLLSTHRHHDASTMIGTPHHSRLQLPPPLRDW